MSMRRPACECGANGVRLEKYDAYMCPQCDKWLEEEIERWKWR